MYCLKNGYEKMNCDYCSLRESAKGVKKNIAIPDIESYKDELTIKFGEEVIAKDFVSYFGELQRRILQKECEQTIVIDLSDTRYINHFCISKILLTLYLCKDYKKVKMCLPNNKNKMLRYIYNLGILDYIFKSNFIECYILYKKQDSYEHIYDFSECYDHSILPYQIFEFDKGLNEYEQEKEVVEICLNALKKYYCEEKEQPEKYSKVESRSYLYLQEIIDNEFKHAYVNNEKVIFAINIYNSYLPPYAVYKGTVEERKFENRINKLQRQVPMSVYKDIQDRYFGGFNIFIDDVGVGIKKSYIGEDGQEKFTHEQVDNIYRDVYINGSKKRRTINGLKLVADQIAINNDILWAHDTRRWIGSGFVENSRISMEDESKTLWYEHVPVRGLTYDIFINLAQNSVEKKKTYEKYGIQFHMSIDQIKDICNASQVDGSSVFVDILNIRNISVSMKDKLAGYSEFLFYRPRAAQKNKMASEIKTRIFAHLSPDSGYTYLVIYDLNQTTLFQIKAVFEDEDIIVKFRNLGIEKVILLTEECWVFGIQLHNSFLMRRDNAKKILEEVDMRMVLSLIHNNDELILQELLLKEQKNFVINANIFWGKDTIINEYVDIEKVIWDRAIADILQKSISRISGMLGEEQKIVFLEKYMKTKYEVIVNEFKKNAIQKIYLGSILMTGDTERKVSANDDIRIYLFKHKDNSCSLRNEQIILFQLPKFTVKRDDRQYRRVLNTNRIELFEKNSKEYNYYLDEKYKKIIDRIPYTIGFFDTGFIKILENDLLDELFVEFISDIVKIKLLSYDNIRVEVGDELSDNIKFKNSLENEFEKINISGEYRSENKLVKLDNDFESNLIIKIEKNVDLVEIISQAVRSSQEIHFISLFCPMRFEKEFYKIVDAGFMPFLPFYYKKNDALVDNDKIENFKGFIQTLNPQYRTYFNRSIDQLAMNYDLTLANINKRNELLEINSEIRESKNFLWMLIYKNLKDEFYIEIEKDSITKLHSFLINLFLLQHSVFYLDSYKKSLNVNCIFSGYEMDEGIEDSVITYMILIALISFSLDRNIFEKFYDKGVVEKLLNSKSVYVRLLFANFYHSSYAVEYQELLNEFFVSNDITIYYNMLAQLLFNAQHGRIHDSKIDKFYKKLDENMECITDEDISEIKNLIPNCISLLKLTRSYDKSIESENALEKEFALYVNDIKSNLIKVKDVITKIKKEGEKRFVIINKSEAIENVKEYISSIIERLDLNGYEKFHNEISNINVSIADGLAVDTNGFLLRDIKLYNDTMIIEELSYLIHNAHNHSFCLFSIAENYKAYKVWVRVELKESSIIIRLLNSIERREENFEIITGKIHGKKRIGKTYLEKFNIHVSYIYNPRDIEFDSEDYDIMETHIELPYFN